MEKKIKSYYNCSVDGCLNSTLNGVMSFFKLPIVSERRTQWLRLINREDLIDSSCCRARVCEAHFSPNSIIINSSRKLLKRNSIPQLLLPLPNNFANKGIQAIIETADANVQCDYDFQTNAQNIDQQSTTALNKDTQLETPKERRLRIRLRHATNKIRQQTLKIKLIREQNHTKTKNILGLKAIIEKLKNKSHTREKQKL